MPKTFTCWRVTNVKLNLDLKVPLKVSHAVWEKGGRGPGFHKFSLRNIVLCKSHCQLLRCNTMFFWSPKFLEANKLGEVLTWHLNKRKHISSTLFSLFQVFHCWLSLYLMDFLFFFALEYHGEDCSQKMTQHLGLWVPRWPGHRPLGSPMLRLTVKVDTHLLWSTSLPGRLRPSLRHRRLHGPVLEEQEEALPLPAVCKDNLLSSHS